MDVNSQAFRALDQIEKHEALAIEGRKVRFSPVDLLRLMSSNCQPLRIKEEDQRAEIVKRLLALKPALPGGRLRGMVTPLRPYQMKGVDWLRFLFENNLGGLLCDDMGLGKTHQTMALMISLRERNRIKDPFLIVCPTTVISHWMNKIPDLLT